MDERTRGELVNLVADLVRIPSVNPPGNEGEIARFVQRHLANADIQTELVPLEPGRESLVARVPGSEPGCIVLCGHLDTVDVQGGWSFPPFSGRVEDGKVYGRGAADMKGGVAAIVEAARWVAQNQATPRKSLLVALTADEERGYRGAKSLVEAGILSDAEFLLITEPTDGAVFLGQKGELWLKAAFSGQGAHGSVPHLGVNAALAGCDFGLRMVHTVDSLPERVHGKTTINLGRISGGWQVNVVPDSCEVEVDVRLAQAGDRELVLKMAHNLGRDVAACQGARFELAITNDRLPIEVTADVPYMKELLKAVAEVTSAQPRVGLAPYSTDAVEIVPRLGVPLAIYGPGSIAQAHRPDEFLELGSLFQVYESLVGFLRRSLFGEAVCGP